MNWKAIRKEYETTDITLKALADKHGIKDSTLRSRKNRDKWQRNATKSVAKNATKKSATQRKNVATKNDKDSLVVDHESKLPEPVVESEELTEQQRLFCLYYIKYLNATKAYQKAYQASYRTAHSNAYRLMAHDGIKREIQRLTEERANAIKLDTNFVLQKLIDIAFADITDYVEFGVKKVKRLVKTGEYNEYEEPIYKEEELEVQYVDVKDSSDVDGALIKEVKQGKDGTTIKLHDKMKALELLAKYVDLLPDTHKRKMEEEQLKVKQAKLKLDERLVVAREKDLDMKGW